MLETVTQGFKNATDRLKGVRELNEESIDEALRDVRMSLLEADVDLKVTRSFLARVKERGLGEKVKTKVKDRSGRKIKVTPGQHFIKICEEELIDLMGPVDSTLADSSGIRSVMLAGLQGVGKTTIAAKLAVHLRKQGKKPCSSQPTSIDPPRSISCRPWAPRSTSRSIAGPRESCRPRSAARPSKGPSAKALLRSSTTPPADSPSTTT